MIKIMNRVEHAKIMCQEWHAGQVRKYTNEPYHVHPFEVMEIVQTVEHTEAMLCAALLHDVVEDTPCTMNMINNTLGNDVAELVEMLTDVSNPEDGNRAARKAIDLVHISKASPQGKTIKLADLISNTSSIVDHDPGFARIYLDEKERLLEVLKDGDIKLWIQAENLLQRSKKKLRQLSIQN